MEELNIEEFINALQIRRKWNAIPSDKFIKIYLNYYKPENPEDVAEDLRAALNIGGLNNSDLIPHKVVKF